MNKHDSICQFVKRRCDEKPSLDTYVNREYGITHSRVTGEVDVGQVYINYGIYYEVKCRDHYKNEQKALRQTIRWSKYMKKNYPGRNYYGVYYTPTCVKLLCKNGEVR